MKAVVIFVCGLIAGAIFIGIISSATAQSNVISARHFYVLDDDNKIVGSFGYHRGLGVRLNLDGPKGKTSGAR